MPPDNPRQQPARTAALTGLIGSVGGGGRRAFVDATGTPVALPPVIRRIVATDDAVGALLVGLDAPVVGCAGVLAGVEPVGDARAPDPQAVAALHPDVIVTGAAGRAYDLADERLVVALSRVAPVVAVDAGRPAAATADLRALLGRSIVRHRPEPEPFPVRPPGPPVTRPQVW